LKLAVLAAAWLVLVTGCAVSRPPLPVPRATLDELESSLRESGARFRSLKGLARVAVTSGDRSFSGSQVLLAEKPDRIRSEALALFGQPWLILAANGELLQVFVPGEQRFYRGAATPENLQRFTRLPLRIEDLVHLLLYQVPVLEGRAELLPPDQGLLLQMVDAQGFRQELGFDTRLRLISSRYLDADGRLWLAVSYGDFRDDWGGFPEAVELQMPGDQLTAEVHFRDLELNTQIAAEKFMLKPPAGVPITPLALPEEHP